MSESNADTKCMMSAFMTEIHPSQKTSPICVYMCVCVNSYGQMSNSGWSVVTFLPCAVRLCGHIVNETHARAHPL